MALIAATREEGGLVVLSLRFKLDNKCPKEYKKIEIIKFVESINGSQTYSNL